MKRFVLSTIMLFAIAPNAMAQSFSSAPPAKLGISFAPRATQDEAAHRGFTIFINAGVGVQRDAFYEETSTGLAGLNLGVGWFVRDNVAILFRISGTRAKFDSDSITQMSAVYGGTAQFWVNRRFAIEAGGGLGRWSDDSGDSNSSFGLIVGATAIIFQRGSHHITAGAEYAPVFDDAGRIDNLGFVIGYQFARAR